MKAYHRRHDDQFQLFRESDGYYRYADGYFIRGEADTARFTPTFFYTFHNRHRTQVSGTDAAVLWRLHHEVTQAMQKPALRQRLDQLGLTPIGSTPEAARALILDEIARARRLVAQANIPQQ